MCNRHSFIVTRAGKVHDGHGTCARAADMITPTELRSLCRDAPRADERQAYALIRAADTPMSPFDIEQLEDTVARAERRLAEAEFWPGERHKLGVGPNA